MKEIITFWLDNAIDTLKNYVNGINIAAEIYSIIENELHIPSPYSTYLLFTVIAVLIIGLFLLFGYIFYGAENKIRKPPKK